MKKLALFLVGLPAFAGTLAFSDFGPDDTYGGGGWVISDTQSVAAPFTPSTGGSLSQVRVVLGYGNNPASGLTVHLTSSGSLPTSAILESWSLSSSDVIFGGPIVSLTSAANPSLYVGSQYWLTIGPTSSLNDGSYNWTINNQSITGFATSSNGGAWSLSTNVRPTFDVTVGAGATGGSGVPEPSTFGLAILAVGSLLAGGRVPKGDWQ